MKIYLLLQLFYIGIASQVQKLFVFKNDENIDNLYKMKDVYNINKIHNINDIYNYKNNITYTYYDKYIDHIHKLKIHKINGIVNILIYESKDYNWQSTCKIKGFTIGKINYRFIQKRQNVTESEIKLWERSQNNLDKQKTGFYYIKLCNNYDTFSKNHNIIFLIKNYDFIDIMHYLIYGEQYNSIYPLYSFIDEKSITSNYSNDNIILKNYSFVILYKFYISIKNIFFLLLLFCLFITGLYNFITN